MNTTPLSRIPTLSVLLLFGLSLIIAPLAGAQNSRSTLKNFQHVFVIMMENTGFDTLIGNSMAALSAMESLQRIPETGMSG